MKTFRSGFTLIELLIVVAIIGILAAIAVPNFMNARVRAQVARVQADMKNIATAIDTYQIDYKGYPIPGDELGRTINLSSPNTPWTATKLSPLLTTPIPYMSTLPFDPCNKHSKGAARRYHYATKDYSKLLTGDTGHKFDIFVRINYRSGAADYLLHSYGPDGDSDVPEPNTSARYDVTNGINSSGDVLLFKRGPNSPSR